MSREAIDRQNPAGAGHRDSLEVPSAKRQRQCTPFQVNKRGLPGGENNVSAV